MWLAVSRADWAAKVASSEPSVASNIFVGKILVLYSFVTFAFASCADYQEGYFPAYRAIAEEEDLDVVFHPRGLHLRIRVGPGLVPDPRDACADRDREIAQPLRRVHAGPAAAGRPTSTFGRRHRGTRSLSRSITRRPARRRRASTRSCPPKVPARSLSCAQPFVPLGKLLGADGGFDPAVEVCRKAFGRGGSFGEYAGGVCGGGVVRYLERQDDGFQVFEA